MGPQTDLTGRTFGKLTVVSFAEMRKHYSYWNCLCQCGKAKVVRGRSLITGGTRSCGCIPDGYSTRTREQQSDCGRLGGIATVESGHLKRITDKQHAQQTGIFDPINHEKGSYMGRHIRWHRNRGIFNPKCEICCQEQNILKTDSPSPR